MKKAVGIIPARYGSTRFPGKPLHLIYGKTLIQRTLENAQKCACLEKVIVATDDLRIFDHVSSFGGEVVMTSQTCMTGTDRLIEVVKAYAIETDIILNIQGDEPFLEPEVITKVIEILAEDTTAQMSTAIIPIYDKEEIENLSVVKCVPDLSGNALYFSRSVIPGSKSQTISPDVTYYKHLGIYGYRKSFLLKYGELAPTPLQLAEDLEQLKVLEHGYKIKTAVVKSQSIGIDTPEDLNKIELLWKQNSSL